MGFQASLNQEDDVVLAQRAPLFLHQVGIHRGERKSEFMALGYGQPRHRRQDPLGKKVKWKEVPALGGGGVFGPAAGGGGKGA